MRLLASFGIILFLGCAQADEKPVASGADAPLPADLGTRKDGSDWPGFLGPHGDSVSTEKGIISPRSEERRVGKECRL